MRSRRKSLKSNTELGQKLARIRWDKDRARKDLEEPSRKMAAEVARALGEGPIHHLQYVGTLQWSDARGNIKRWVVRRGYRSGQVMIDGQRKPETTTSLIDRVREHIAGYFRIRRN